MVGGIVSDYYKELSEQRKKEQEEGGYPEWYSTGGYQMFKERYLYDAKNFREQAERIANTAAKHLFHPELIEEYSKRFFNMLWNGWLSPSTPVLANMGTNRGMPVSCSGTVVEDSISGFYKALEENAVLTQEGFGTAVYLGNIRPRGSKISRGGKSSGITPVLEDFVTMSQKVSQGGVRRGSIGQYIPLNHGDFWEIIKKLESDPDSLNIGWNIYDEDIIKLQDGDEELHTRRKEVLRVKMITGKGYFFFPDKVNRHNPQCYKDKGMTVKTSQLCVAPETLILTKEGYQPIVDLEDESLEIWNGYEWSEVTVKKTGVSQKLLTVETNSGFTLDCTPYHKFYVAMRNPSSGNRWVVEKRASELQVGDKLVKCDFPVLDGSLTLDRAYENGFFSGDGCEYKGRQIIYLYGAKKLLLPNFINTLWNDQQDQDRLVGTTKGLKSKFFVPVGDYTIESKIRWLEGVLDADGTVCRNGETQSIQLGNINYPFLQDVQLMLQTLGVSSKVTKNADAGYRKLPLNDGSGESGDFYCQEAYRLMFGQTAIVTLRNLGFSPKRLKLTEHKPNRECSQFVKVTKVVDHGRTDDTYCFTEPKRNMGVFNGILTGNCNEITLFADKDHTFTCVLSSLNLARYNEWKDTTTIQDAIVFLDCVASEFIEKGSKIPSLEKAIRFTEKGRALGLGVCGYSTYLQQESLPFESMEAYLFNADFFKHMREEADKASAWLAKVYGEPEWCKGYGRRNTHCLAIAPTKSTALLMGGVSEGINPDPAMTFTQASAAGDIERVNPTLLNLMKHKGVYTKKNIQQVIDARGSVQGVDWLTEHEKAVFKTAFEINQYSHKRKVGIRGKYLDQWQSWNTFFAAEEDPEYISLFHKDCWLDEEIRGMYYVYSKAGVTASKDCESCQ